MTQFVILKRAGEPGKVAINPALVTEIRSTTGPIVDIHFGDHRVAVEGSLQQVVSQLSNPAAPPPEPASAEGWLSPHPLGTHRAYP